MDHNISILFDFYAKALTEKQREVIELYHNQDLSLAEITEHIGITRQGVRDSIKRGEATMISLEEKLGFVDWFFTISRGLEEINRELITMGEFNDDIIRSAEISAGIRNIDRVVNELRDVADVSEGTGDLALEE